MFEAIEGGMKVDSKRKEQDSGVDQKLHSDETQEAQQVSSDEERSAHIESLDETQEAQQVSSDEGRSAQIESLDETQEAQQVSSDEERSAQIESSDETQEAQQVSSDEGRTAQIESSDEPHLVNVRNEPANDWVDDADDEEDEEDEDDDRPPSRVGRRVGFIVAFCILLLLVGTALGAGMFFANGLQPVEAKEQEVKITIEPGMNSAQIAKTLEGHGLIRSEFVFRYYLRMNGEGSRFQAGEYMMKPGMALDEMVAMLNSGDTVKTPTFRFTIPEGYTIERIADKLAEEGIVDRAEFMEQTAQLDSYESEYISLIPDNPDISHRLEGYLFPETYEMKEGSTEQEIIARMISELERKLAQLPEDWQSRLEETNLTFHEIMTIASMIEREVAVDAERPIVASVIYNRLEQGMMLQIDATVQYALQEHKEVVLIVDTEVDSPYNTYQVTGLPPGPIASPGIESIRAALYPDDTSYLFYVTKKDGSQEHLFAETYNEHLRNKAASERQ